MSVRVLFVGISTGGSLVHRVFPAWMELLGIEAELEGVDLPVDAPDAAYRALVERIGADAGVLGAVITSHKLGVHRAARDRVGAGDPYVDLLGEANVIARRPDGRLVAHATDPLAIEATLPALLADDPPACDTTATAARGGTPAGREAPPDASGAREPSPPAVLCLGAGGAGVALLVSVLYTRAGAALRPRPRPPRRVVLTDARADRLATVERMLRALPSSAATVELVHADDNDRELARLPAGALVVNTTGLGKDAPGSPLSDGVRFPERALVWDANYRGRLRFLDQARAQAAARALRIHNGWTYFLHGWAQALTPILQRPLDGDLLDQLAATAEARR